MLRKVLVAISILFVCVVFIVVIVFQMTGGIVDVAETFFSDVKAGNFDTAYETYLSEEFKATTSKANLKAFFERSTLSDYSDASWDTRSIKNNQGQLEGSVTSSGGGTVPLSILLVKEKNSWKILSISLTQAGLTFDSAKPSLPDLFAQKSLVTESVYDLALAINTNNFSLFYNKISDFWKSQTTTEELKQSFLSFIQQQIDLTGIKDVEPVFSAAPAINDQGFLKVTGYFPTQPAMVYFNLGYTYEHPDWKLIGVDINVK